MRIAVAELEPPHGRQRLGDFVVAAAAIVNGHTVELIPPDEALQTGADAVVWEAHYPGDPAEFARRSIPVVRVVVSDEPPGPPVSVTLLVGPQPDNLRISTSLGAGANSLAEWLGRHLDLGVTLDERKMLEVVLSAVRRFLEDGAGSVGPEDLAQIQAAADTIDAQLRAPRPARGVLLWAVGWLSKPYPAGLVTGVAATYLVELINRLTS
jgi:hypothetical protein